MMVDVKHDSDIKHPLSGNLMIHSVYMTLAIVL